MVDFIKRTLLDFLHLTENEIKLVQMRPFLQDIASLCIRK